MKFEDLKKFYLEKKGQFGAETYKHISELLKEAKEIHKRDWLKHPTPNGDHEQSWRAFKGKNLEKLVQYIITDEVEEIGLKVVNG
ncbi:MAG TPA: DNA modification methylase, partial [Candidatus Marinimicrobia bacterium]|nr:DNA modification methylase [Candidatus Neomarinimicrobiota bacterium]